MEKTSSEIQDRIDEMSDKSMPGKTKLHKLLVDGEAAIYCRCKRPRDAAMAEIRSNLFKQ
jgi:hypothetical protein